MLDENKILENKERFINLLNSIKREGADIQALIKKLENSDFFIAPASTQYHCGYKGGLCEHSLNVYDQLCNLIKIEYPKFQPDETGEMKFIEGYKQPFSDDSLIITALLHDISKMNFYETAERNVKDANGNWTKVPFIKTRDAKERFLYGNHEQNSVFMVSQFMPLSLEEEVAILHHMGGKGHDSAQVDLTPIYNKFSLAVLLHLADMAATFISERM